MLVLADPPSTIPYTPTSSTNQSDVDSKDNHGNQSSSLDETDMDTGQAEVDRVCINVNEKGFEQTHVNEQSDGVRIALDALMELGASMNQFNQSGHESSAGVQDSDCVFRISSDLQTCFSNFLAYIPTAVNSETKRNVIQHFVSAVKFLTYFLSLPDESWVNCSRLITLMDLFHQALQSDKDEMPAADDMFGLSFEHFTLLNIVSDWLGNEFRQLQAPIQKRTNEFKCQNLLNIGSLPSAGHLIDTLFPVCMKSFFYNWLPFDNPAHISHSTSNEDVNVDHSYAYAHRESSAKVKQVQVILELGTNCLISGIAHVVYSRLRLDPNKDT